MPLFKTEFTEITDVFVSRRRTEPLFKRNYQVYTTAKNNGYDDATDKFKKRMSARYEEMCKRERDDAGRKLVHEVRFGDVLEVKLGERVKGILV